MPVGPQRRTPDDGPGFYQGISGRKTGRPSPRPMGRVSETASGIKAVSRMPRREQVMAAHGLLTTGEADPNQGQIFNAQQYEKPLADVARERGLPPPLESSKGGWLSGIEASPSGNRSANQRKVEAVSRFAETRGATPFPDTERIPGESPQAHHMRGLTELRNRSPNNTRWYGEYKEGSVGPGQANEDIAVAASKASTGITEMTRATAVTSPQTPWTAGNPQYPSRPNIDTAVSVAKHTQIAIQESGRRSFSRPEIEEMGTQAPGQGLHLGKGRAALAFNAGGETAAPIPAGEGYGKVPNFNEALQVGRQDVPRRLRAAYAGSYTSDLWDLTAKGLNPETFHKKAGQYEVDKMLSTRAALKRGELPPQTQEATWERTRGIHNPTPLTASIQTRPGRYENMPSLLHEDQFTKKLSPSFDFSGGKRSGAVPDQRSETAKRMGLEF